MTKNIIKAVVDKADPMGLLAVHCPTDEYDSEVEMIFARIRNTMTEIEIAEIFHAVFFEMFNESIDKTLCDTMAKELGQYLILKKSGRFGMYIFQVRCYTKP